MKKQKKRVLHKPRLAQIDAYLEEILVADTVADQLPFQFRNGFKVESIQCFCLGCKSVIPQDAVNGLVWFQDIDPGHQGAPMLIVEAAGYCAACDAHSPLLVGIFDDGAYVPLPPNRLRRSKYASEVLPDHPRTTSTKLIELAHHLMLRTRAAILRVISY